MSERRPPPPPRKPPPPPPPRKPPPPPPPRKPPPPPPRPAKLGAPPPRGPILAMLARPRAALRLAALPEDTFLNAVSRAPRFAPALLRARLADAARFPPLPCLLADRSGRLPRSPPARSRAPARSPPRSPVRSPTR